MCGICGIVDFDGRPIEPSLIRRMSNVLTHRGPDGEGFYVSDRVALGARRLAIIDVAAGRQPLTNEDGTVWVAYNGEIYNFAELRTELISKGHVFRTHCDTEVVVHAYEEWGDDCVLRFNGMFAFAVWDEPNRRLLLARDRMGVKPLVYAQLGGRLLFASEIKALLQDSAVERIVDLEVLGHYLSLFSIPEPRSMFTSIKRLPAGHVLIFEHGQTRLKQYWDVHFDEPAEKSDAQWLDELEALLADAVRIRLVGEVPVGAFLSGGIDSSLIVAMMARTGAEIKTTSVEFPPGDSGSRFAQLVSDTFETDHQRNTFESHKAWQALPHMVWQHDEPSQSLIQNYFVSQATRERVTVALSGLGGDELFTGYPSHVAAQCFHYLDRVPRPVLRGLQLVTRNSKAGSLARLNRLLGFTEMSPDLRFASRYLHANDQEERLALLSSDLRARIDTGATTRYFLSLFATARVEDIRSRVLYVDQKGYLANELLRTADSMSMAHSLEVRTPFLDFRVVELAARMPVRMKVRGLTTKYALRKLAEQLLPKEIACQAKRGFNVPLVNWIGQGAEAFVRDHLSYDVVKRRGYFDPQCVTSLLDQHFAKRMDCSQWIMMLLTFEIWHGMFIDGVPAHPQHSAYPVA